MTTTGIREIILSSGAFATLRKPVGEDMLTLRRIIADRAEKKLEERDYFFLIITIVTKIDDAPLTYEQLVAMDFRDVDALQREVTPHILGPLK